MRNVGLMQGSSSGQSTSAALCGEHRHDPEGWYRRPAAPRPGGPRRQPLDPPVAAPARPAARL